MGEFGFKGPPLGTYPNTPFLIKRKVLKTRKEKLHLCSTAQTTPKFPKVNILNKGAIAVLLKILDFQNNWVGQYIGA